MRLSRTKIDRNLSNAERAMLVDWLMERSANPTGSLVEHGLRELGLWDKTEAPSHNSINDWLRKAYVFELARAQLKQDTEAARVLAEASGGGLDAANRELAQAILFDQLRSVREAQAKGVDVPLDVEMLSDLTRAVVSLGRNAQNEAKLAADLEKARREKADWEEQRSKARSALEKATSGGLTPETLQRVEEALNLL